MITSLLYNIMHFDRLSVDCLIVETQMFDIKSISINFRPFCKLGWGGGYFCLFVFFFT